MRVVLAVVAVATLSILLSGCVVVDVVGAGVSVATTAVTTTVDVAGSVVSGAAHTVSRKSDDDKAKSDADKDMSAETDGDDDDDK